jgi:hypothetical protein
VNSGAYALDLSSTTVIHREARRGRGAGIAGERPRGPSELPSCLCLVLSDLRDESRAPGQPAYPQLTLSAPGVAWSTLSYSMEGDQMFMYVLSPILIKANGTFPRKEDQVPYCRRMEVSCSIEAMMVY